VSARALLLCPGRGSYGKEELGSLAGLAGGDAMAALGFEDARRMERGQTSLLALDSAASFRPGVHLKGENAAPLIFAVTALSAERLAGDLEPVAVAGNSLGWYTALTVAGALSFADGLRLVTTMARLQGATGGGQLLYSLVDESWRLDPEVAATVRHALAEVNARGAESFVAESIRLGGHVVLAGTERGLAALEGLLPRRQVGKREFPLRLAGHGPFHTRLLEEVAARAAVELADLPLARPRVTLIDGRGASHSPWSADPGELRSYTLGTQVTTTFDFTAAVRVGLREFAPDVVVCLPPGRSLSAPVGHVMVAERWRGIDAKDAFTAGGAVIHGVALRPD
jgi:acyl transferase domain-containing protein